MEVDFGDGTGDAVVNYPSLQCGGRLVPQYGNDTASVYIEEITRGIDNCLERGRFYVLRTSACHLTLYYESLSPRGPDGWAKASLARTDAISAGSASPVCGDGDLLDAYCPSENSYHVYTVETRLCQTTVASCSRENAFGIMIGNRNRIAPTRETGPVQQCSTTTLRTPLLDSFLPSTIPLLSKTI